MPATLSCTISKIATIPNKSLEEFQPDGRALLTYWEWESGIPLPPTATQESPHITNTSTTTTNATADTNATAAPEEEEGEGNEEGEDPNEFEDCVVSP
jgi:hypothetical protein